MVESADEHFLARFVAGDMAPVDFDHRAHLRVAWCALHRHPFLEACIVVRDGLAHVARKAGKPGLYHETVTIAFMALIRARMTVDAAAWPDWLARHPELLDRGLLDRHYRPATLASDESRSHFVLPDIDRSHEQTSQDA